MKKWENNRDLTLIGEPIFRCKRKTFSVQTADGVVKVLGTHFNVKQRLLLRVLLRRISERNL
jgi:ferric-dicitrate binding protein FerR (iron transport regulator)